jgi:Domain of unknown function (DUF6398)
MKRKPTPPSGTTASPLGSDHATEAADAEAMLRELSAAVRPAQRERFLAIVARTDAYCLGELAPLGEEYRDVCRMMAAVLCQKGSPVVEAKSKAEGWAAAIVAAVGFVNFLGDKTGTPCRTVAQIAAGFGVSESGLSAKSVQIRKMLDLGQFDPEWTLPSLLGRNPYVWMLETTTGMVVDVRRLPREEQVKAFELGLIPYVPADREAGVVEVKDGADEGVVARIGGTKGTR